MARLLSKKICNLLWSRQRFVYACLSKRRRYAMKKYLGVGILALTVVWPAFVSADSTFSTPAGAPRSSSGFSTPAGAAMNSTVRGEVTRVEGDSYFLRDTDGRELRVQPTKDARI